MYARYSGIGWLGKNTCIINQEIGSWLFLGEIITDVELDYDNPAIDRCGTCTECIDKCPTDALRNPYVLDSNRCISFFTIENKEKIPLEYRNRIENNIFGCDICQDVCPWNRKAKFTDKMEFEPRKDLFNPELEKLINLSQEEFSKLFKNSPVKRAKRAGLIRNVLVAIGNSGNKEFVPLVLSKLSDENPVVRSQAVWAYFKIENQNCYDRLLVMLHNESDPDVIEEIEYVLSKLEEG